MNYPELSKPLYHGSTEKIASIDLSRSAPFKDFGRGFYTTNDRGQAEKFAKLKANRLHLGKCYVSVFRQIFFGTARAVSQLVFVEAYDVRVD